MASNWWDGLVRVLQPVLRPETDVQLGGHEGFQAALQSLVCALLDAWMGRWM
jgi:hypothetical protein